MAKAAVSRLKQNSLEEREREREKKAPGEGGEEIESPKKESDSSGIRRNAGFRKRGEEYGAGRNGREEFRTERGDRSATAFVSL